jgi:hypothetical protein
MSAAKSLVPSGVLLLLAFVSGPAWAQTSNGTLVGSVVDPTGAVVRGAVVSAISAEYGQPHETHTDSAGTYRLESLQPGVYSVTISAAGFETLTVNGVVISGSLASTINGKLLLAATQERIEVNASAAQVIDTQSGQLGENIGHQELAQLPYYSLNPAELAMTLPGVHDTPLGQGAINTRLTEGVPFSVNGTRPRANNFLIDGQDDNDYELTGQAYQPVNIGAIQEVTILTNAYNAEYGRGGGSVTNYIYKSGTNNFHGDLWEINRNSAFASIPAEVAVAGPVSKIPHDNENTFGFDAGGPLKKDKLFAFGAVQWDRDRLEATGPVTKLPTAAGIATLKANFPANANVNLFLNSIGGLVSPGLKDAASIPTGASGACPCVDIADFQLQNVSAASNDLDWNYRMDWQFTDHDILTGSAVRSTHRATPDNFSNAAALPAFKTENSAVSDIFRGQWSHTISSSLLNELRLSYTSIDFAFGLTPATAANPLANTPFISFGSDISFPSIGVDSRFPQARAHQAWQVQEALSKTAGKHTIKAGFDITRVNVGDSLSLFTRGLITYNLGGPYNSLGNFILDQTGQDPGTIAKNFGSPNMNTNATMIAPYLEDTWRIRNNFTLTMGLRYEYWGAMANALAFPSFNTSAGFGLPNATDTSFATDPAKYDSLFSFKQNPDKRSFAPRIGLAYTPHWGHSLFGDGKTVFRAGYGIFYDGLFANIVDNTAESQPNSFGGFIAAQSGTGTPAASTFPGFTPQINSTDLLVSMASNLHNPLTQQWNADVQRELPLGLIMTLAYVGTRGEHLFANQDFNPAVNYVSMNQNFGEMEIRTNAADSSYHSGQIEVERKIHTLVLRAAYTYSKFMDDSSEVFQLGTLLSTGLSSFSQVLTNQHSDWGPSAFDQRHRFSVAYVWEIPYFHNNGFLRALTDRWQWSGIASIESGTPNTVEIGLDNIGNGHANSRPDLSNPAAPLNSFGVNGGYFGSPNFVDGQYYDFLCWYNSFFGGPTSCPTRPLNAYHFIVPEGVPGNLGRNSQFGPGQIYFDTSIQRDFPIHFGGFENQTLSFRADFFNAFNHSNLFTPSYTMFDINFNNTAITVNSNGGRQIKFWLKYSF